MRVLHIITGLETGGAEALIYRLIKYFPDRVAEHIVCSLKGEGAYAKPFEELGVSVHALSGRARKLFRAVPAIAVKIKPDLIHGWMYHGNLAAALCRLTKASYAPQLWSVHQTLSRLTNEKLGTAIAIRAGGFLSGLPHHIIYNSQVSARQHESIGYRADKTMMIASGFDTDLFKPDPRCRRILRAEINVGDQTPVIGFMGRVHPMKDHRNFLRAAQKVMAVLPETVFVLGGRGTDTAEFRHIVSELDLEHNVHLLGERRDVPTIMAALDLFVLPSAWGEAFPTVVGEAMACGVPCVVTDVGDAGLIVADTGVVVPPADSDALARAILSLLQQSDRQVLGLRARERVIAEYSLAAMIRKYTNLYAELAGP